MKYKKVIVIFISVLIFFFIILGSIIYHFFFSMNTLPHGEFMYNSTSPQATYTVNFYVVSSSLSSNAYRGEVVNNKNNKTRNFYWGYNESDPVANWESDNVVVINGKRLDVTKDTYDWRN